jgi:hypothetical protein
MHANGPAGNDNDDTPSGKDRKKERGHDNVPGGISHGPDHAVGHLSGATLTDHVLRFLERYNQSIHALE